jgi:hypothetical protein
MSDPADTGQRNPLSSSSSHAAGTSARSVTVPLEHVAPVAEQAAPDAPQPDGTAPMSDASFQGDGASPEHQADFAGQPSSDWTDERYAAAQPEAAHVASAQPDADPEPDYTSSPSEAIQEAALLGETEQPTFEPNEGVDPIAAVREDEQGEALAHDEPAFSPNEPVETFGADASVAAPVHDEPITASAEYEPLAAPAEDSPAAAPEQDELVTASAEPKHALELAEPALRVVPAVPLPGSALPEDTSELRALARQTIAENEARQKTALEAVEQLSRRFTLALEEAGIDAARVSFKVMEFAQASMKNNLELAKSYAAARSVPDIFGLHAAYLTRQFELLNAQAEELREIATKMTLRTTASLKPLADPVVAPLDH